MYLHDDRTKARKKNRKRMKRRLFAQMRFKCQTLASFGLHFKMFAFVKDKEGCNFPVC